MDKYCQITRVTNMSFHNQVQPNTQKLHKNFKNSTELSENKLLEDIQNLKIKDPKEFSDKYKQMYDAYMKSNK